MHELPQNFVMETCSLMDSFYQELITTSKALEEEAWDVIGACIKKMFETIRVQRAQASNAMMDTDLKHQCVTYLWALLQLHKIMKEFTDARLQNHGEHYLQLFPASFLTVDVLETDFAGQDSSIQRSVFR